MSPTPRIWFTRRFTARDRNGVDKRVDKGCRRPRGSRLGRAVAKWEPGQDRRSHPSGAPRSRRIPTLLAELNDVLARPRLASRLDSAARRRLRGALEAAPVIQEEPAQPVSRDPKDDYLVALARSSGADFLISGDKDLTDLVGVLPPVMTPAALVARLESES